MNSLRFVPVSLVGLLLSANAFASTDTFGVGNGQAGALVVSGSAVINQYAQVTNDAAAGATTLSVNDNTGFSAGKLVLIWQTTGLSPAPASGNQATLDLSASPVGNWELARIASVSGPTGITLAAPLLNNVAKTITQVVSVPEYTTVTVPPGATIQAAPWDGSKGGILTFLATGAITNNGVISTDGRGFRGAPFVNGSGNVGCTGLDVAPPNGARKGEGLAPDFFGALIAGRGNISNGAGGGICHNSGGGGGGNAGRGGIGGRTWRDDGSRVQGGFGGSALGYSLLNHITFGGGGGAGHGNDNVGTSGGNGGGSIFVRAGSLNGIGRITANGGTPPAPGGAGNDAQGGGGAGGSIYLRFMGSAICSAIQAKGGNGGSTPYIDHGPGGGGGGGRVFLQASTTACPADVSAGTAGTQGDPAAPDGTHYGATPFSATDATSIGLVETAPLGAFCSSNSQCGETAPVCNVPAGTCVQCLVNTDCGNPALFTCDPTLHVCSASTGAGGGVGTTGAGGSLGIGGAGGSLEIGGAGGIGTTGTGGGLGLGGAGGSLGIGGAGGIGTTGTGGGLGLGGAGGDTGTGGAATGAGGDTGTGGAATGAGGDTGTGGGTAATGTGGSGISGSGGSVATGGNAGASGSGLAGASGQSGAAGQAPAAGGNGNAGSVGSNEGGAAGSADNGNQNNGANGLPPNETTEGGGGLSCATQQPGRSSTSWLMLSSFLALGVFGHRARRRGKKQRIVR